MCVWQTQTFDSPSDDDNGGERTSTIIQLHGTIIARNVVDRRRRLSHAYYLYTTSTQTAGTKQRTYKLSMLSLP